MSALAGTRLLTLLGWTLALLLFQTGLLALLVSAWGRVRPATARRRHRYAFTTLLAAIPLGILTYWILASAPQPLRAGATGVRAWISVLLAEGPDAGTTERDADRREVVVPRELQHRGPAGTAGRAPDLGHAAALVVGAGAALWAVIAVLLLGRLAGGLWLARRIRRRAVAVEEARLQQSTSALAHRLGIQRQVALLESPDLEGPIATGWLRPAVVLPLGLRAQLGSALLEPLIAHELEHVRRKDQLLATTQALAEALVFFSPGSRWLAREARLAREQCCDDVAVRACGDRAAYASALAALVGVVSDRPAGALGAEAPRLSDRIRRVLEGEAMKRMTTRQATVLVLALVATASGGILVGAAAFADTFAEGAASAAGDAEEPVVGTSSQGLESSLPGDLLVSAGIAHLPGAPVSITGYGSSGSHVFDSVQVRNVSESRLTSITLAAVFELWPQPGAARPAPLPREPLRVVRSRPIPVTLGPGEETRVSSAFLPWTEVQDRARTQDARPQLMLTVIAADEAGSGTWQVTPKPGARDFAEAFHLPRPFVSIRLVGSRPANPHPNGFCRDDRGLEYSEGALVPIDEGKPPKSDARSRLACCAEGVWRAWELGLRCP